MQQEEDKGFKLLAVNYHNVFLLKKQYKVARLESTYLSVQQSLDARTLRTVSRRCLVADTKKGFVVK